MRSLMVAFTGLFATLSLVPPAGAKMLPVITETRAETSVDLGGPPLWEGRIAWGEAHAVLVPAQTPVRPAQAMPPPLAPLPPPLASGRPYLKWYKKRFAAGEDVQFSVGFKPDPGWTVSEKDLASMRLTIDSPDGKRQTTGNDTFYEGGFPGKGWLQPRTLPKASPGKYILEYRVGFPYTTGKVPIQVETLPPMERIKVGFEWPSTSEITREDALPVAFTVQNNSDQTIRFPVRRGPPDTTGWNVVMLALSRNEPAAQTGEWTDEALRPSKSTRIEMANYPEAPMRQASTWPSIVLKPGESYRQELSLHDVMDRLPESVWRDGAFQIEIRTAVDLLIGDRNGPWAAFNPVHLEVSDTKDFKLVPKTAAPAPFADVPRDHWAYGCVSLFARHGIALGYPDGTFGGRRLMTRYEFAAAIARVMLPVYYSHKYPDLYPLRGGIAEFQLTPDDIARLRRLFTEFHPEMGLLKKDVPIDEGTISLIESDPSSNAATLFNGKTVHAFDVVPAGAWPYETVKSLLTKGLDAFGNLTLDAWQSEPSCRYEFAVITIRMLEQYKSAMRERSSKLLTPDVAGQLDRLVTEFSPEFNALHVQVEHVLGVNPADLLKAIRVWQADPVPLTQIPKTCTPG